LVQLTRLQKIHDNTVAENAQLKKDLTEAKALVDRIKASSTSRLRESAAPVDGKLPIKPTNIFNTNAGDALDAIAQQVSDARRAAGN
jgi:hypothetical protein